MGCPAECVIGDDLVFTVTTHDPDTGILTDADGAPTYRVYEDETGAAILNGSMAILDNANTTGFYSELIACTAANGFEDGLTYSIYIEATVDADTGGISFGFKAKDPPATQAQVDRNGALSESRFGFHTWQGNLYYVDPINGDTFANGNRGGRSDPLDSVQDCHDNLTTDSNHDVIILVAGDAGSPTTMTEDVTLSNRYLFIRGPGRDFIWTRSGNGDTISITADGVSLSGFQLNTANTGSGNGIQITDADFVVVRNVWVNATRGDGINILRGDNCQIVDNTFTDTGQSGAGQAIHIIGTAGSSNNNVVRKNLFRDAAGDTILVEQGTTNNTTIQGNTIEGSSGWGVNIGASSTDAVITDNRFANNSSGAITDAGTTTVQLNNEQWAMHSIATEARLAELDAANLPADVDAALADTNELQTDWTDGGRLDLILDARADQTTAEDIETDTQDIQSRIPAALVSGRMSSDAVAISGSTDAADKLEASAETIVIFTVEAGTLSTTQCTTNLTEATTDHYQDRVIVWATGVLAEQATDITAYSGTGGLLTYTATTEAPSAGDVGVIT